VLPHPKYYLELLIMDIPIKLDQNLMTAGKLSMSQLKLKVNVVDLSKKPMVENQEKDHNNVEL